MSHAAETASRIDSPATATEAGGTPFLGLAPFLRASVAGSDLRGPAQEFLARAQQAQDDANLWMNLSTAFFSLGQRELGFSIQGEALAMQRRYELPARRQPARYRLLMLMAPGDLAENTPLDCLLEDSCVDLICYYATPEAPLPEPLPAHDALIVTMSEHDGNRRLLQVLEERLANWPRPVLNRPQSIPHTDRGRASQLLQHIPGLLAPLTYRVARATLAAVRSGAVGLEAVAPELAFPVIVRPLGSQAGRDLARIAAPAELEDYLARVGDAEFFIARFVDYSGDDGLFRKLRIALLRGQPYICHMAISAHWMIHYLNAGMYEDAGKRVEEERFMADFAQFAARHAVALAEVHRRFGLDYVCIDCAETRDGEFLVFEIDHTMVVHAMDSAELFPFKPGHIRTLQTAFENLLGELAGQPDSA